MDRSYRSTRDGVELPVADFSDYRQIDRRLHADALLNVRLEKQVLPLIGISADPPPEIVSFTCEPITAIAGQTLVLSWKTRYTEDVRVAIEPKFGEVEPVGRYEILASETTTWTLKLTAVGMNDITSHVKVHVQLRPGSTMESVAQVRSAGGDWRRGRGFSRGELEACGVNEVDAARREIRIDRRRRSAHPTNITTLRSLIDA